MMLNNLYKKIYFIGIIIALSLPISADSFIYNSFNNHGSIGLINTPSARFYDEGSFGITIYDGTPDQKVTLTSSPYSWLEASFFYTNIQGMPYPGYEYQDYKDKGFNIKVRLKEQNKLPAIAIGINDLAGTGFYSSEYIVGSYEMGDLDFHFGLGWGTLNGLEDFQNPLTFLDKRFENRPDGYADQGGQFQPSRYFSDESVSSFFGISYALNDQSLFKIERDPTLTSGQIKYASAKSKISFGFEHSLTRNFSIGIFRERDNFYSLKFIYKRDSQRELRTTQFKKLKNISSANSYVLLRRNLQNNGIGVNKIVEKDEKLALEVTQFKHNDIETIESIIKTASIESGIKEEILTNFKIVDLSVKENFDQDFTDGGNILFERNKKRHFYTSNSLSFRPFLASREEFFKGAILLENNSEWVISDNFLLSSNLKYSIIDNFDDFSIPPRDTYPAQVRSDVKDYLENFDSLVIGRAQADYFKTISPNHHIMVTGGILEEMFSGYGMEYLYFDASNNYAAGIELFHVKKRDYQMQFGTLDYTNVTAHANFYYRNYGLIPFDAKISVGEYLAGDRGTTIDLSRNFKNGIEFGVFASFTDVSSEQFGEGSFDKGIYFNIPIFQDFVSYTWRPLTKDPGQKLIRKNNLYDLLVKFKPIN